jgi:hypothetical protein
LADNPAVEVVAAGDDVLACDDARAQALAVQQRSMTALGHLIQRRAAVGPYKSYATAMLAKTRGSGQMQTVQARAGGD